MKTFKALLAVTLLSLAVATSASAKSIWDEITDSAPLQPEFETLRDSAP
jgi:hypothetical protein